MIFIRNIEKNLIINSFLYRLLNNDSILHRGSIEVNSDGTKTIQALFNELYGKIDTNKLTKYARLKRKGESSYSAITYIHNNLYVFNRLSTDYTTGRSTIYDFRLAESNSSYTISYLDKGASYPSYLVGNYNTTILNQGDGFILYY